MVSSAVRSALMAILGVVLFHDNLTTEKIVSIIVIVIGSVFYTWIKDKENKPAMTYNNEEYEQLEQQPLETIHVDSDTRRNSEDILFEAPPEYSEQDAHR